MEGNDQLSAFGGPDQVQLLYLTLSYLRKYEGSQEALLTLEDSLRERGAFGEIVTWDGSVKNRGMGELQNMFSTVSQDQLVKILKEGGRNVTGKNKTFRMYHPMSWLTYPERKKEIVDLMKKWADIMGRIRNLRSDFVRYQGRLLITNSDFIGFGSVPAVDLTRDDAIMDGTMQSTLREIGKERITTELRLTVQDIIQQYDVYCKDVIPKLEEQLRKAECLNVNVANAAGMHSALVRMDTRRLGLINPLSNPTRRELFLMGSKDPVSSFAKYRLQWTVCGHMGNPAYCSVFDQTGNYLLTGADDYLIKIWDVNKGLLVRSCKGHLSYISLIAVSPDNALFASCCVFGTIRVWRMSDGVCLKMMKHEGAVNWIKFDSASCAIASAGDDGQCIVWDLSELIPLEELSSPLLREVVRTRKLSSKTSLTMDEEDTTVADGHREVSTGIFDWSHIRRITTATSLPSTNLSAATHAQGISGMLPLPHVSEELGGLMTNTTIRVACLDICPVAGVIVTGSDDAVARVWRFDKPRGDYRYPNRTSTRRMFDVHRSCYSTADEFATVQRHLLLRLEGHLHPVTDVHFNSMGDRVVTGSNLDGTVRIWSMDRNYLSSVHLILDLSEQDDVSGSNQSSGQPILAKSGRRTGPRTLANNNLTPKVHNVAWTCDDARIVTIQSIAGSKTIFDAGKATRLKVWDAMTGDLLRIIFSISDVTSSCLARHPFDPHIVVTSGEDGFVNVWNIEQEMAIAKIPIQDEENQPADICDISISLDGTRLAATDKKGRVSLISLDNPEKFKHFPFTSQYFSTDYSDIYHDSEGFAFDVGTQLPLHQAPMGLLCRSDGSAYEIQPPQLPGPPALSLEETKQALETIETDKLMLLSEMDRVHDIFIHNKRTNRLRIKYRYSRELAALSSTNTNVKSVSQTGGHQNNRSSSSNVVYRSIDELPPLSSDDSERDSDYKSIAEEDEDDLVDSSSSDSYAGLQLRRSGRAHRPTNYSDAYDGEEDDRRIISPRPSRRAARRRRSYRDLSSDEDGEDDRSNDRNHRPSGRRARSYSQRRHHIILDDDGNIFNNHHSDHNGNMKYSSDGDDDDMSTSRQRTRRSESSTSSQYRGSKNKQNERKNRSKSSASESRRSMQNHQHRRHTSRNEKWIADESGVGCLRIPLGNDVHRAWLQSDLQYDMLYMPQLGDEVVYFPQGHAKYLESFPEEGLPACNRFRNSPFVECVVQDIRYVFPNQQHYNFSRSIVAIVTLLLSAMPSRVDIRNHKYIATVVEPRSTRRHEQQSFVVSLRSSSCADFVIPKIVFYRALTVSWQPNLRITSHFCDTDEHGNISFKEYAGSVVQMENSQAEWPMSPWMTLLIRWDPDEASNLNSGAEEISLMSFWEIQPDFPPAVAKDSSYMKMKLPSLETNEAMRIANGIELLLEQNPAEYAVFEFEPDPELYPEYRSFVALPMTLHLIVQRLKNGYYRQFSAVEHDVNMIVHNCRSFNVDDAPITQHVLKLQDEIHRLIHINSTSASPFSFEDEENDKPSKKRLRQEEEGNNATSHFDIDIPNKGRSKRLRGTVPSSSVAVNASGDAEIDKNMKWSIREEEEDEQQEKDESRMKQTLKKSPATTARDKNHAYNVEEEEEKDNEVALRFNLKGKGNKSSSSMKFVLTKDLESVDKNHKNVRASKKQRSDSDNNEEEEEEEEEEEDDYDHNSDDDSSAGYAQRSRQSRTRPSRFRMRSASQTSAISQPFNSTTNSNRNSTRKSSSRNTRSSQQPQHNRRHKGSSEESEEEVEEEEEEEEEDEDDEDEYGRGKRRASLRTKAPSTAKYCTRNSTSNHQNNSMPRTTRSRKSYVDEDEKRVDQAAEPWHDEEDDDDSEDHRTKRQSRVEVQKNVASIRTRQQQQKQSPQPLSNERKSRRSAVIPSSDDEEETFSRSRRSQRQAHQQRKSYREMTSDDDDEVAEDKDEDEEEDLPPRRSSSRLSASTNTNGTTTIAHDTTNATSQRRAVSAFNNRARQHNISPPAVAPAIGRATRHTSSSNNTLQQHSQPRLFLNADVNDGRRRLSTDMKRQLSEVIDFASNLDADAIFQEPVDGVEGYLDIISDPMDFTTIRAKAKRLEYGSMQELLMDIALIYRNCILFNGENDEYGRYAARQKRQFLAYLRKNGIDPSPILSL